MVRAGQGVGGLLPGLAVGGWGLPGVEGLAGELRVEVEVRKAGEVGAEVQSGELA